MPKDAQPSIQHPTCTVCGKEVKFPNFQCEDQPGSHELPVKKYFDLGASHVQSVRDRRLYAPMVVLVPRYTARDNNGAPIVSTGLTINFQPSGIYETTNAEEQYYLDRKRNLMTGEEGQKAWDKVYLNQEQQKAKLQSELDEMGRQIKESNALLENVKRQQRPNA